MTEVPAHDSYFDRYSRQLLFSSLYSSVQGRGSSCSLAILLTEVFVCRTFDVHTSDMLYHTIIEVMAWKQKSIET